MYTVGQVAEFLGISKDTLKFYEKKGLVQPTKDDENGYRRYNDYDIWDIITVNFYRHLDIGIKDIQEIRVNKSTLEIEELLEEKKQQIEAEIDYKQQLLEKIKILKQGCYDIRNNRGTYAIKEMLPLRIKGEISSFFAYKEYDVLKADRLEEKKSVTLTNLRRVIYFNDEGIVGSKCIVVEPAIEPVLEGEEAIIKYDKCIYMIVKEGRANKQQGSISEK